MATITPLPTPPQRTDDEVTFANRGDALLGALPQFVTEANALIAQADADSASATASASAAAVSATSASASAQAAANASGAVLWVSGTTYAQYAVVYSPVDYQSYRKRTPSSSGTTDPSLDYTNWAKLGSQPLISSTRSSNTILTTTDNFHLIRVTGGTFSQTFSASSSLMMGWYCIYRNEGSGVVTLTPNGAETIAGVSSLSVQTGEAFLVQSDGSNLNAFKLSHSTRFDLYTVNGTFSPEPGRSYFLECVAGGGGGGSGNAGIAASLSPGDRGTGGQRTALIYKSTNSNSRSVVVGAGGTGGSAVSTVPGNGATGLNGAAGGTSSIGTIISSTGGAGGGGGSYSGGSGVAATSLASANGGAGGVVSGNVPSNGLVGGAAGNNVGGTAGTSASGSGSITAGNGGNGINATEDFFNLGSGGGGGGGAFSSTGTVHAGNGGNGVAGSGGGGGGAAVTASGSSVATSGAGGNGGDGFIRIWTL